MVYRTYRFIYVATGLNTPISCVVLSVYALISPGEEKVFLSLPHNFYSSFLVPISLHYWLRPLGCVEQR